MKGSFS